MTGFLQRSIVWQLILPIPVLLGIGVVAIWLFLPPALAGNARDSAVRNATQIVGQFKTLRSYYTNNVIRKVLGNGGSASFDHANDPAAIPLPATVIHDMSALLSAADTTLQLYSPFPFPNRADRQLDEFQSAAWQFLVANPDDIFTRQETRDGQEIVRVAVADRMVADACVACHNARADTPKNDWQLGDVRGVLEVAAVIDDELAAGAAVSNRIIGFGAVGGLLLMLLCVFIGRRMTGAIVALTGTMTKLADGDTDVAVTGAGRADELGAMARTVEVFKQNAVEMRQMASERETADRRAAAEKQQALRDLADTFEGGVQGVVDGVTQAAAEMHTTAEGMSQTVEQARTRAQSVADAAQQASGDVQTVASAAEELAASNQEIGRQVSQSSQMAGDAAAQAQRTDDQVQGLVDAAKQIGDVVSLISDIAEQTNLLALNATIEAARAGDAGKGFAVVASEVKSLANQTAKATEDISQQVAGIQHATTDAAEAIQGIAQTVSGINDIATAIAAAVEEQGAATNEIARSVQDAAAGTSAVSTNISSVTKAAEATDQSASGVLTAAKQLTEQARSLSQQVASFLADVRAA